MSSCYTHPPSGLRPTGVSDCGKVLFYADPTLLSDDRDIVRHTTTDLGSTHTGPSGGPDLGNTSHLSQVKPAGTFDDPYWIRDDPCDRDTIPPRLFSLASAWGIVPDRDSRTTTTTDAVARPGPVLTQVDFAQLIALAAATANGLDISVSRPDHDQSALVSAPSPPSLPEISAQSPSLLGTEWQDDLVAKARSSRDLRVCTNEPVSTGEPFSVIIMGPHATHTLYRCSGNPHSAESGSECNHELGPDTSLHEHSDVHPGQWRSYIKQTRTTCDHCSQLFSEHYTSGFYPAPLQKGQDERRAS